MSGARHDLGSQSTRPRTSAPILAGDAIPRHFSSDWRTVEAAVRITSGIARPTTYAVDAGDRTGGDGQGRLSWRPLLFDYAETACASSAVVLLGNIVPEHLRRRAASLLFVSLEHALKASSARWCAQLLPPFTTLKLISPAARSGVTLSEGFSHFITSMTAPVASGWSGCRVGLAPTGKAPPFHGARHNRTHAPLHEDWCRSLSSLIPQAFFSFFAYCFCTVWSQFGKFHAFRCSFVPASSFRIALSASAGSRCR
jgi:hypothetical protein